MHQGGPELRNGPLAPHRNGSGRELRHATSWKTPIHPVFAEDSAVPLPIEPCEYCAAESEAKRRALELLRKALTSAEADSKGNSKEETPKDGLEPRPQLPEEDE